MTTVKRKAKDAFNPVMAFAEHLTLKTQAATITNRSDTLKKRIKEWLSTKPKGFYTNQNGSLFYDLPETLTVKGQKYKGMELRRSVSSLFDEEKAEKIVRDKGLWEEATVRVIDQEKINRLVAEDKISEKELDAMFVDNESFAFWAVKGEVL